MRHIRLMAAAGLVAIAAACSSNAADTTSTADETLVTDDISAVAADGVAEDVDMMAGMDGTIGNTASLDASISNPGAFRPNVTGCSFANGSFTCPATTKNGLTVTRTITFYDAGGATESAYDPTLTASIHVVADVSGNRTHGPWTATVTRHHDFTITGLAGTETTRTVNGTGSETVSNSRSTANPRAYTLTCSSTATNVVMPVRDSDGGNGWPISGTETRTCTITQTAGPNAGKTFTRTVTVTFDGTSTPSGTIDGQPFTFDCASHMATRH